MSWRVSPCIYPVCDSLCLLDLIDYFHVGEIFNYNLFKNFLISFLFLSSSGTPIIRMLVCLILSQRSLRLSSVLFILFALFCSSEVISTTLSSSSMIHSASDILNSKLQYTISPLFWNSEVQKILFFPESADTSCQTQFSWTSWGNPVTKGREARSSAPVHRSGQWLRSTCPQSCALNVETLVTWN